MTLLKKMLLGLTMLGMVLGFQPTTRPTQAVMETTLNYSSYEDVIQSVENGIATIYNYSYVAYANRYVLSSLGSGFVFHEDATYQYVLTNEHVVNEGDRFDVVTYDFNYIDATLMGKDAQLDVAVLRVPKTTSLQLLKMGDSNLTSVGEEVIAIGNPMDIELKNTTTVGVVSGVRRNLYEGTSNIIDISQMIQIDAAVNPGNSGGPLINMMGEVIGINSMAYTLDNFGEKMETVNFSIPINSALIAAYHIMSEGEFNRPNLGLVQFRDIAGLALSERNTWKVPSGVIEGVIIYPLATSILYSAGITNYSHLLSYNGVPIHDVYGFRELLYRSLPGDTILLEIDQYKSAGAYERKTVEVMLPASLS